MVLGQKSAGLFADILASSAADSGNVAHLISRHANYGKGAVSGIYNDIAKKYLSIPSNELKQTIAATVSKLLPTPLATVVGNNNIHLTVNKKNKATLVHLVNNNVSTNVVNNVNEMVVTPTSAFNIDYRATVKPESIFLEPGHTALKYTYSKGVARIGIPQIDIYSIVVIR